VISDAVTNAGFRYSWRFAHHRQFGRGISTTRVDLREEITSAAQSRVRETYCASFPTWQDGT